MPLYCPEAMAANRKSTRCPQNLGDKFRATERARASSGSHLPVPGGSMGCISRETRCQGPPRAPSGTHPALHIPPPRPGAAPTPPAQDLATLHVMEKRSCSAFTMATWHTPSCPSPSPSGLHGGRRSLLCLQSKVTPPGAEGVVAGMSPWGGGCWRCGAHPATQAGMGYSHHAEGAAVTRMGLPLAPGDVGLGLLDRGWERLP